MTRHKPTKAQVKRFERMVEMGCICCKKLHGYWVMPEIHHIVEGSRRLGHDFTLPLCIHHHRIPCEEFGPSIASGSKLFSARWGTQRELLAEVNRLLEE